MNPITNLSRGRRRSHHSSITSQRIIQFQQWFTNIMIFFHRYSQVEQFCQNYFKQLLHIDRMRSRRENEWSLHCASKLSRLFDNSYLFFLWKRYKSVKFCSNEKRQSGLMTPSQCSRSTQSG